MIRAFVCLALLVSIASAQFGIPFPDIFGGGGDIVRLVSCTSSGTSKTFSSIRAGFSGADTLSVVMTTLPVPTVSFAWTNADFSGANVLAVKAAFPDLVEFETGATIGYSAAKGGVSANLTWEITSSNCEDSGEDFYYVTFSANATEAGGVAAINCTLPTKQATFGTVTIPPTAVKCDYSVNGFPYTSGTSRLALKTEFAYSEASIGFNNIVASDCVFGLCVKAGNGKGAGFFDWVKTADVSGGASINIVANMSGTSHESTLFNGFIGTDIWFTFDAHQSSFIWDPQFGVTDQPITPPQAPPSNEASFNGISFVTVALVLIASVLFAL